jgi:hypothetical protein
MGPRWLELSIAQTDFDILSVNGRSMNRLRTNALQNVQQHGCQAEIN